MTNKTDTLEKIDKAKYQIKQLTEAMFEINHIETARIAVRQSREHCIAELKRLETFARDMGWEVKE